LTNIINKSSSLSKIRGQFNRSTHLNSTLSRTEQLKRSEKEESKSKNGLNDFNTVSKPSNMEYNAPSSLEKSKTFSSVFQSAQTPLPEIVQLDLSGKFLKFH